MQRYFVLDDSAWQVETVTVSGEDYHHIAKVMRMEVGDAVTCVNRIGEVALCQLIELNDQKAIFSINEWEVEATELPIEVTIAQGIPKSDKFELILQKGTELGACKFIPFEASRSVTKWNKKKFAKRLTRFEKIVKEASEQSKRQIIPGITYPVGLKELIKMAENYDYVVFAYEEATRDSAYTSFSQLLESIKPRMKVLICIGPEGGFSQQEVEQFIGSDWTPIRLGKRILRTETAPLYVLSSISYHLEEFKEI